MNKEEVRERLLNYLQCYNRALKEKSDKTAIYRTNIIKYGDLQYMYIASTLASFNRNYDDLRAYECAVLKSRDLNYYYMFAKNIPGVNIDVFQKAMFLYGNAKGCYLFARDVKNVDIKAMERKVIASKNAKICCMFAEDIEGADVLALQKVVMESKNISLCEYFLGVQGADKKALNQCIRDILQNKTNSK